MAAPDGIPMINEKHQIQPSMVKNLNPTKEMERKIESEQVPDIRKLRRNIVEAEFLAVVL